MNKKLKSTSDEFIESLTPKERKKFEEGYKDFVLSELLLAIMEQDDVSVRKLAKMAGVSPTSIQSMRTGLKKDYSMQTFFKILKGLGFNKFIVGRDGHYIPIDLAQFKK